MTDIDTIEPETCQICAVEGTTDEPLIRVWGDDPEPDIYCAHCYTNSPVVR